MNIKQQVGSKVGLGMGAPSMRPKRPWAMVIVSGLLAAAASAGHMLGTKAKENAEAKAKQTKGTTTPAQAPQAQAQDTTSAQAILAQAQAEKAAEQIKEAAELRANAIALERRRQDLELKKIAAAEEELERLTAPSGKAAAGPSAAA